jgi:hypothetical protein
MNPLALSSSLLLLLRGVLVAQPAPGDWLFADRGTGFTQGSLFYMPPNSGASIPWIGPRAANPFQWLLMSGNNRDLVVLYSGAPNGLAFVTPAGNVQTLATFGGTVPHGAVLDQDGSYVVSTQDGSLFRVPLGGPATLLLTTGPTLAGVTIDQDTGDYVLALSGTPGTLERVNRRTLSRATFATGLGSMTSIAFEPRTGSFVVTDVGVQIRRVTRSGQVSVVNASYPFATNSIKVDEETGNLLVVGSTLISLQTASGNPILSSHLGGVTMPTGVEIYGSRKVSGFGAATPGSVYTLNFKFPSSPGAIYVAALSTGLRPGLTLPDGRTVNLDATSPLFRASIGGLPGVTTAFSGNLDGGGFATASIQIPQQIPAGFRVCASAVALNPQMPNAVDTANSWAFSVN